MERIKVRRGDAAEWTSADPVLADGEPGFERDTGKVKIGDGATAWTDLDYIGDHAAGSGSTALDGWVGWPALAARGLVVTVTATSAADTPSRALNGSVDQAQFYSNKNQAIGDHVTFDFGVAIPLAGFRHIDGLGTSGATDYARNWELLGSTTGAFAGEQVQLGTGTASAAGTHDTTWETASYRYLRMRLTSALGSNHWRANEFMFNVDGFTG